MRAGKSLTVLRYTVLVMCALSHPKSGTLRVLHCVAAAVTLCETVVWTQKKTGL
jgi:hypothetical protein